MAKVDRLYQEIHLWDYFRFSYLVMFCSITKVDSGIFWTVERHILKLRNQRKPNRSAIESLRLTRWAYRFRGIYRKFRKDFYEIEEFVFSSIAYETIVEFVTKAILVKFSSFYGVTHSMMNITKNIVKSNRCFDLPSNEN